MGLACTHSSQEAPSPALKKMSIFRCSSHWGRNSYWKRWQEWLVGDGCPEEGNLISTKYRNHKRFVSGGGRGVGSLRAQDISHRLFCKLRFCNKAGDSWLLRFTLDRVTVSGLSLRGWKASVRLKSPLWRVQVWKCSSRAKHRTGPMTNWITLRPALTPSTPPSWAGMRLSRMPSVSRRFWSCVTSMWRRRSFLKTPCSSRTTPHSFTATGRPWRSSGSGPQWAPPVCLSPPWCVSYRYLRHTVGCRVDTVFLDTWLGFSTFYSHKQLTTTQLSACFPFQPQQPTESLF